MPSRGSYAVTSREEGKAAQRDQSYRSCVLCLLIFFLLCIVLILASWPWKKSHHNYHNHHENDLRETARVEGEGLVTDEPNLEIEDNTEKNHSAMSEDNVSTESPELPVKSGEPFERYLSNASTESPQFTVNSEEHFERYINNASTEASELPVSREETFQVFANNALTESLEIIVNREKPYERYLNNSSTEPINFPVTHEEPSDRDLNNVSTEKFEINFTSTTPKQFETIDNETQNSELGATVQTSTSPETTEEIIFNQPPSTLADNEITYKSNLNERHSISTVIVTPRFEESVVRTTETSSTTTDYSTDLTRMIKDSTKQVQTTRQPDEDHTSLLKLVVARYFGNESTTSRNEASGDNWFNEMEDQRTSDAHESLKSSESTKLLLSTSKWINTTAVINSERITTSRALTEKEIQASTANYIGKSTSPSLKQIEEQEMNVCTTGKCKQIASKLLSYMNHSADPCQDFYEYACGGLEADYQINEKDLSLRVYETIELQAKKSRNHSKYAQFNSYYDSCLKYETNFNIEHRIDLAREALEKIGKFYTTANWPEKFQGFTQLFSNMLLHDRTHLEKISVCVRMWNDNEQLKRRERFELYDAQILQTSKAARPLYLLPLLFDIVPDVSETNPDAFTLKIGPAVDNKIFQFTNGPDLCYNENDESLQSDVDLDQLYYNYKNCKNDTRRFVASIKQALTELGIFDSLKNNYNISQYVDRTLINIDLDIIKKILWTYPSESEIQEAYRSKHYIVMTLGALQDDCKLLNWTELIHSLTGLTLGPEVELQIYYKDQIIGGMRHLEEFGRRQPLELNNAMLGLYARNLYQDLVATRSSRDFNKQCLYIAAHYMEREASGLYMSSFTESEIINMKTVLGNLFRKLKETLHLEIRESEWGEEWGREVLLKKLSDMKMSLPNPSLVKNKDAYELNITDNYFVNNMNLMKKYRSMIYSVITKNPRHLEQIWTFFASPFEWTARTIYGLNLIVMPFGAVDWSSVSETGYSFDYLTQATIGNLIAREIAHNFDTNGIRYWNGTRDSEFALLTDSDATKATYEEYINCHRNLLYQKPMEMSLPMTAQRVSFTISPLSLNERLSDVVGMRLASDTLARLGSAATKKRLPWLDLDVSQLFYLAYAQTHCTKAPLTSSYVSLHEDPFLPSRIRVFVVASNDKFLSEAWKCSESSKISSASMCDAFPHLENRAVGLDAV